MIKCFRDENKTAIEVDGAAHKIAADFCEIVSAVYRATPAAGRELFKAVVLIAVTHKDSPMWDLNRRETGAILSSVDGELERHLVVLRREKRDEGGRQCDEG